MFEEKKVLKKLEKLEYDINRIEKFYYPGVGAQLQEHAKRVEGTLETFQKLESLIDELNTRVELQESFCRSLEKKFDICLEIIRDLAKREVAV